MLLTHSIRTRTYKLNRTALLISAITSIGLSACSTQQMSKSVVETNSSTVSQQPITNKEPLKNKEQLAPVVVSGATPVVEMVSADYASNNTNSPNMLTRSVSQSMVMPSPSPIRVAPEARDNYQKNAANPVHRTADMPVATLSIDTDTGSYANIRRYLNEGQLPPAAAVRVEEMINYFPYDFSNSRRLGRAPFMVETELVDSPWDKVEQGNQILKVGIKAIDTTYLGQFGKTDSTSVQLPPANLVFLVDVSGSMQSQDKLPLAKSTLNLLSKQLRAEDSISIVTYSGSTKVVLPTTRGNKRVAIQAAINGLQAAGSTNGEDALKLAYNEARKSLKKDSINRILMLTDGDFNVGISDVDEMLDLVKANRNRGISLSTIGFGRGNLNDYMMEQMADNGNGNYSYIDSLTEAKKVLSDELASTFNTVASDVKIQIEFNPEQVEEWRLIGYENRVLAEQDFNNDKVDAGELGAGKAVVALFEITPKGQTGTFAPRRYAENVTAQTMRKSAKNANSTELGFLKIRYKTEPQSSSQLIDLPIKSVGKAAPLNNAHPDTQFAVAVAGFGQRLQQSPYINNWQYSDSKQLANQSLSYQTVSDTNGLRRGFVQLTELADALQPAVNENMRLSKQEVSIK
ncbi:vWA domain-containing protein [Psychrobacter sp. LV10R520-6]|uniref:vWA domain-containing protein n=1 Tax=Psychrobacter sp. LV10R520-6 TaxID=1415574 RepID=UPI0024C793DD|nr:VWA domain-containing protein [Psychrobacter sp. LV10R520-6]SNT70714.1 Ca-activated chloride channel family protein [Psychrobacter sp. LV10R520-6]